MFALVVGLSAGGCASNNNETARPENSAGSRADDRFAAPEPGVFDDPAATGGGAEGEPNVGNAASWTIFLGRVQPNLRDVPQEALRRVKTRTGLRQAEIRIAQSETGATEPLIVFGRYDGPEDPRARQDLARIRAIELDGGRPYANAFLLAPELRGARGSSAVYDLRNAEELHGDEYIYTLQVGVYARADGRPPKPEELAEFRTAAEEAVAVLRRDGEQAFFYHGPSGSTVTVGLFTEDDHDASVTPPLESRELRAARERHPYNLLNGQGVRDRIGDRTRLQPSRLVAVP